MISTRTCGPIELLDHGKYGMLVNQDIRTLYEALKNLILNESLRNELSLKARERKEWFATDKTIKQINKLLSR